MAIDIPLQEKARKRNQARFSSLGLLILLSLAQLMVILDISAVNVALPDLTKDLGIGHSDRELDDHELFADLRQPASAGRARRRPDRTPARIPHRPGRIHGRVARLRAGGQRRRRCSPLEPDRGSERRCSPPPRCRSSRAQFKGHERARALGVWGAVGGAGAAIGVLLGGLLTQLVDWRADLLHQPPDRRWSSRSARSR